MMKELCFSNVEGAKYLQTTHEAIENYIFSANTYSNKKSLKQNQHFDRVTSVINEDKKFKQLNTKV